MTTLWQYYECMKLREQDDLEKGGDTGSPLLGKENNQKSLEAIRQGINVTKPNCGSFWDDFITVCGNADAMASLLEVPKIKVTGWASKIRNLVDEVEAADNQEDDDKKIIPTGNQGGLSSTGAMTGTDTRPYPS